MNLPDALPAEAIVTLARADDWRAAVRMAGERLVASGATTDAYTDEMLAAIDEHGPYIVIAPGFALAHARPSPAVLRTGLSWVSLAKPVPFGHSVNDPVRLVAAILADSAALDELLGADSPSRVRDLLVRHSPA